MPISGCSQKQQKKQQPHQHLNQLFCVYVRLCVCCTAAAAVVWFEGELPPDKRRARSAQLREEDQVREQLAEISTLPTVHTVHVAVIPYA